MASKAREIGLPEEKTKVFISYSRKDRQGVTRLAERLSLEDDIVVFRDTEDILPTEEWKSRLEQLIVEADTVIFALSPASAESEVCQWEIDVAEAHNKRVAPIVLRDVASDKIPESLTKYNYIFFTTKDDFDKASTNLVRALHTDIDWIREHTRLEDQANRWNKARKLGAIQLRGSDLSRAEQWLANQPRNAPQPTELHRRYILECRKAATRRQRMTIAGSLSALVIALFLAGLAYWQRGVAISERNEALRTESRFLAKQSTERAAEGDHLSAIELALLALPDKDLGRDRPLVPVAESALQSAVNGMRETWYLDSVRGDQGLGYGLSKNGQVISVSTNESSVLFYRVHEFEPFSEIRVPLEGAKIWEVIISGNGKVAGIQYGTTDKYTVGFWNIEEQKFLSDVKNIEDFALSDTGKFAAATFSYGETVISYGMYIIDLASQDIERHIDFAYPAEGIEFHPDDKRILFIAGAPKAFEYREIPYRKEDDWKRHAWYAELNDPANIIPLYDLSEEFGRDVYGSQDDLMSIETFNTIWLPDGNRIATSHRDGQIRIWDVDQIKVRQRFKMPVGNIQFSPDGKFMTGSSDDNAYVWDFDTGNLLAGYQGKRDFLFAPNSKTVAVSKSSSGVVEIMSLPELDVTQKITSLDMRIWEKAITGDGKHLVVRDNDNFHSFLLDKPILGSTFATNKEEDVIYVQFSNDSSRLIATERFYNEQFVWDLQKNKLLGSSSLDSTKVGGGRALAFDEGLLISNCTKNYTWRLLRWSGEENREYRPMGYAAYNHVCASDLKFSPDKKFFAFLQRLNSSAALMILKDLSNTEHAMEFRLPKAFGFSNDNTIKFSPNSKYMLVTADDSRGAPIALYDLVSKKPISMEYSEDGKDTSSATFSANGNQIYMYYKEKIRVWNTKTGKLLREFPAGSKEIDALIPLPDGKRAIAVREDDRIIQVINLQTGQIKTEIQSPDNIKHLDISPDANFIVTGGWSSLNVRIWDLRTGKLRAIMSGLQQSDDNSFNVIESIDFSNDGLWVAAGTGTKQVKYWRFFADPEKLINFAKQALPRRIPEERLRSYEN